MVSVPLRTRVAIRSFLIWVALFHPLHLTVASENAFSSIGDLPDSVFHVGEELTYNVSYASFDIGQIKVKQTEEVSKNNQRSYRMIAYIDSYRGVPFVNLHAIFESIVHPTAHSLWFRARDKQDQQWMSYVYNFDYPKHAAYIEVGTWESGKIDKRDTVKMDTLCQDGLSLFFYARKNAHANRRTTIPVMIDEKKFSTEFNFSTQRMEEEIDAVEYPVDVLYFEGEAGFVGIFGLTGGFEGWFSNDAARVPILAKMKVIIGNVKIELMSWKRDGWTPPRYVEESAK